jgi:hypothetical protein
VRGKRRGKERESEREREKEREIERGKRTECHLSVWEEKAECE